MDAKTLKDKRKQALKLYYTGKYTQKQIAEKTGISVQSICMWIKEMPATSYAKTRRNLAKELESLSVTPTDNEDLIFKYIEHLNLLDIMIRKAKYLPEL